MEDILKCVLEMMVVELLRKGRKKKVSGRF